MTRLEQLEFENEEKFMTAIKTLLAGTEAFKSYTDKDGNNVKTKIISKGQLFFNQFGLKVNKANNGKVYVSVNYFSFDDRMEIHKKNSSTEHVNATIL